MTDTDTISAEDRDDSHDHDDDHPDGGAGRVARWVASDESMVWLRRVAMGATLVFLVGALGYFVGVRTTQPASSAVDTGFLRDMTDHHDQAVAMAITELANESDKVVRDFAMEVILFQRQELGRFQNFQAELGSSNPEYDVDRTTMEWMDMATPLAYMSGMATDDQLKQLSAARGVEADKLFLSLMQTHHIGGAHMADYEAQHGANPDIKQMADRMATNQRVEAREYQGVLDRLNAKK